MYFWCIVTNKSIVESNYTNGKRGQEVFFFIGVAFTTSLFELNRFDYFIYRIRACKPLLY